MLPALLANVPVRNELDRAALAVHSTMLEHGFVSVGASTAPVLSSASDGAISMQVVPPGWNSSSDSYSFGYVHPLRGSEETFTVKALSIGSNLAVHAESSTPGGDLLSVTLTVEDNGDSDSTAAARAKDWQEKIAMGVSQRLLSRHNSTARLGSALEAAPAQANSSGTKRRVVEDQSAQPPDRPERPDRFVPPFSDPFRPDFFGDHRPLWVPDGGLLGPRHPAWGQVLPGRGGGMMPRFDPIGPGEPDPDHMRLPGRGGGGLPTFHDLPPGRGGFGGIGPDSMFM